MKLENRDIETLNQLAQCLWVGNRKVLGKINRAYQRHVDLLVAVIREAGRGFRSVPKERPHGR